MNYNICMRYAILNEDGTYGETKSLGFIKDYEIKYSRVKKSCCINLFSCLDACTKAEIFGCTNGENGTLPIIGLCLIASIKKNSYRVKIFKKVIFTDLEEHYYDYDCECELEGIILSDDKNIYMLEKDFKSYKEAEEFIKDYIKQSNNKN